MPDVYPSLQTGVYEGVLLFPSVGWSHKLFEPAPHYKIAGFGSKTFHGITINLDTWKKLPADVQKAMLEAGQETEEGTAVIKPPKPASFDAAATEVVERIEARAESAEEHLQVVAGLDDMSGKLCRNPDDPSWVALNAMLLQLIYGIDETSVHMLLFWHENQTDEAEWSWRRSYGYMLLAFKIARYLASREWAIDFRSGAAVGGVGLPRVGVTSSEVRQIDQDRYISLKSWAGQIAHADQSASDRLQREPAIDALMEQLLARLSELSNPERVSAPNLAGMMERYRYPG